MKLVWALIGVILFVWVASTYIVVDRIEQAGGIRQVIVDAGKEVKSIYNEIQEDEQEDQTP